MIEPQTFRLKDCELTRSATVSDNDCFEPALVISKHNWHSRPRKIHVRCDAHPTAEVAIESARAQHADGSRTLGGSGTASPPSAGRARQASHADGSQLAALDGLLRQRYR